MRGKAIVYSALRSGAVHGVEGARNALIETLVYRALVPVEVRGVLHLLKVTDRNTTGVAQNIGQHKDASLVQNLVRLGRGGTIGKFSHNARLYILRVAFGNHILQRRREEHANVEFDQLFVAYGSSTR